VSPIVAILLFLHVLGAIVAFGPTFTFSLIAGLSRQYPQHGPFGIQLSALISRRLVLPMAVVQGLTGLGLVIAVPYDILAIHWLTVGIVLYLIDLAFAFWVQLPAVERMVAITKPALSGGPPPAAAAPAGVAPSEPPAGPPPELAALGVRVRNGGFFMTALLVAIVFLMVVKPTF
jgi:hypothetical protein